MQQRSAGGSNGCWGRYRTEDILAWAAGEGGGAGAGPVNGAARGRDGGRGRGRAATGGLGVMSSGCTVVVEIWGDVGRGSLRDAKGLASTDRGRRGVLAPFRGKNTTTLSSSVGGDSRRAMVRNSCYYGCS